MRLGIHTMKAERYHDDPCERPSLSASIASILCSRTPAHAKAAHPKLNPDLVREEKTTFDVGTVVHALLLEKRPMEKVVTIVDAADWRTNAAKAARDEARESGRIPLLAHQVEGVTAMVDAAARQLAGLDIAPSPFTNGKPERTIVWEEPNGVLCRARLDWLHDDFSTIDDFKTTSASADPERWTRVLFQIGADVQTAFYTRGVKTLKGTLPVLRYVVQETYPPYALSVVSLGPAALEIANAKVDWAITRWGLCLEQDRWAGYPDEVCWADLPPWEETRWLEKEGYDVFEEVAA